MDKTLALEDAVVGVVGLDVDTLMKSDRLKVIKCIDGVSKLVHCIH